MKWSELKKIVEEALEKSGVADAEIWYFDTKALNDPPERADVHIGEFHHPGEIEIYVDLVL